MERGQDTPEEEGEGARVRTCVCLIFVTRFAEAQARSQYSVVVPRQPILRQNIVGARSFVYKITFIPKSRVDLNARPLCLAKISLEKFRMSIRSKLIRNWGNLYVGV